MIKVNPAIEKAMENKRPVVALESTIITHGMPYPENLETGNMLEELVREGGAVPATIAIVAGVPTVGITSEEMEALARMGTGARKVSTADIPFVCQREENGGTTVAGTMFLAGKVGIKVFATGGIGGVHRNWEKTFDVSADLMELSRTNVNVVCAGMKSILDLAATLEYMESMQVPIVGYQSEMLPAFYSRTSSHQLHHFVNNLEELAAAIKIREELNLPQGLVVANPIPKEFSLDAELMETQIEIAVAEAEAKGIHGKKLTPFLLQKIKELTEGKSLISNIELVKNNVRLATELAKLL